MLYLTNIVTNADDFASKLGMLAMGARDNQGVTVENMHTLFPGSVALTKTQPHDQY